MTRDSVTRVTTPEGPIYVTEIVSFCYHPPKSMADPTRIVMSAIHLALYLDTSIDCIACLIRRRK